MNKELQYSIIVFLILILFAISSCSQSNSGNQPNTQEGFKYSNFEDCQNLKCT